MAPARDPPEDNSEPTVLAKEGDRRPREQSDAAPTSKAISSKAKTIKLKYIKDLIPVPDGVEEDEWNKAYNNANSQLHVKGTTKAADARASGETRELALKLIANKRRLAAEDNGVHTSEAISSQNSHPQALLSNSKGEIDPTIPHSLQASHNSRNGESSSSNSKNSQTELNNGHEEIDSSTTHSSVAVLSDNNTKTAQNNGDHITSQTTTLQTSPNNLIDTMKPDSHPIEGAHEKDKSTSVPDNNRSDVSQIRDAQNNTGTMTFEQLNSPAMLASLADSNKPSPSMGPPYSIQTTSKTNKRRIVKQVSPEGTQASSSKSIADKVKGKSRAIKKLDEHEAPVNSKVQQPSTFFGRHDIEKPQPFGFDPSSVADFDPKHPFKGKDSLPTPRQEFNELNASFEKMRVQQNVASDEYIRDVPLEPSARSANDFDPDEKWESGPLKRFASFEPFARASPRSPTSSRANSPTPKQAGKASKKKTNRGQKKKAAQVKKKAAAKEEKSTGRSTEPEGEDEATPGASSNDGGSYCICGGPDDHRQMIACDACNIWFHCSCVGVKEGDIPLMDKYICVTCHVPDLLFTTWKPMCRLDGCRMPCDLERDPPSKYCSDEHKAKFWEDAVGRAPDGPGPSRGGALNKGELKALLEKTKGNVKAFHALGKKPTLPTPVEAISWNKILTDEEKARLCQITADKQVLNLRSQGLKDKEKVVRMAMERLKNAIEARKDLVGVCGWDARLAMNEEEFQVWRNSQSGTSVFESGVLDESFCEKRRCLRHGAWVKLTLTECRMEDNLVHKQLGKLRNEEHAMKDRANTRAASQL